MSSKKTRKIRICLFWQNRYYSFCWIEFLEDGSFSVGFLSKLFKMTEYGSAIHHNHHFSRHKEILTSGTLKIQDAISPHITFHPPKIEQQKGIVHLTAKNGIIDEFELDWFPVKKPEVLLCAYTGNISRLDIDGKKKSRYNSVNVPMNVSCVRMELMIYPRVPEAPQAPNLIHDSKAIACIHGASPHYIISCFFYHNDIIEPQFYFLS